MIGIETDIDQIKNENYINVDINLKLNSDNETFFQRDFGIKGYILNEDMIKRKINGEYITLNNPFHGYYLISHRMGLLQINQKIEKNNNFILIEISSNEDNSIDSFFLLEILAKEHNNDIYFMPANQYIFETFDGENGEILSENKYYLCSQDKDTDQVLLEISSGFDDIKIKFDNSSKIRNSFHYYEGFKRYRIYTAYKDNVYFSVINPKKRKVNYMMRYYFNGIGSEYEYYLDTNAEKKIINLNDNFVSIPLALLPISTS